MSTLTAFNKKKAIERAETKERNQKIDRLHKNNETERKLVYAEFKEYLTPFNGKKINGLQIKVVCKDAELRMELLVNGETYRFFQAKTDVNYCNCSACCDGYTGHECSYRPTIYCYWVDKKKQQHEDYFAWYGKTKEDKEENFVNSFDELLKEYKSNMEWYKCPNGIGGE